jgi:hypothetical protein
MSVLFDPDDDSNRCNGDYVHTYCHGCPTHGHQACGLMSREMLRLESERISDLYGKITNLDLGFYCIICRQEERLRTLIREEVSNALRQGKWRPVSEK